MSKGLHVHCFHPKLARPANSVPNIPGIPGPPVGGASSGSSSPSGYSLHSEAKLVRSCHPVVVFFLSFFPKVAMFHAVFSHHLPVIFTGS